uniref:Uncharacterized protein n=1 Tax=Thermogemmatispora argillosa TaxID=2045280 RepID=A0A455SXP1_9CHLR|nr:hypothetical protein KTA_05450 [Thermogemmatispora argillosa]
MLIDDQRAPGAKADIGHSVAPLAHFDKLAGGGRLPGKSRHTIQILLAGTATGRPGPGRVSRLAGQGWLAGAVLWLAICLTGETGSRSLIPGLAVIVVCSQERSFTV